MATETHPYTKTGEKTAKFGVPFDDVVNVARRISADPALELRGLAMHLGSQITDVEPYHRGTVKLLELVAAIRASGIATLEALDVGGGLGVRYLDERAPSPKAFAEAVVPPIRAAGLQLLCEPGRYIVANAGLLLTRVLYRKHAGGKEFVIVDAGMTDFVRPSHYSAHHDIVPLKDGGRVERVVNMVGPICESGDFLALDRKLPVVEPGELLAVLGTGAYGFVMSSTYNQRPRPPEVLVDGDKYFVARHAGITRRPDAGRGARARGVALRMSRILILDYGSQFTQLIARRVREAHVYCEIHPASRGTDLAFIREFAPQGIILSGGPNSVFDPGRTRPRTPACSSSAFRCWASATACSSWRTSPGVR